MPARTTTIAIHGIILRILLTFRGLERLSDQPIIWPRQEPFHFWVAANRLRDYDILTRRVYWERNARLLPFGKSGDELVAEGRVFATTEEAWVDHDTLYFMQQTEQ